MDDVVLLDNGQTWQEIDGNNTSIIILSIALVWMIDFRFLWFC